MLVYTKCRWEIFIRPIQESAGDFPTVCYDAIVSRRSVKEKDDLTVDAVNGLLDDLTRYRSQ